MPTTPQLPRGANLSLYEKTQGVDFKSAATGDYAACNAYSFGLKAVRPPVKDPLLGLVNNNTRDETTMADGLTSAAGPIVVPLDCSQLGTWLFLALGAASSSGAPSDYSHVFTSGKTALPFKTIERGLVGPSAAQIRQFIGVMVNKFSIQASRKEGYARLSLDTLFYDEVNLGAASGAGTPSALPARDPLAETLGVYKMNTVIADLMECNLTFSNDLQERSELGDHRMGGYDVGDFMLESGSIRLRYRTDTLDTAAIAGTEHAGELLYQKTSVRSLSLAMPLVRLERAAEEISNRGVIEQTFKLHARQNESNPLLTATLKGALASYA